MSTHEVVLPPASVGPAPGKGRQTRSAIVDAALTLAARVGLEGLSIGVLAEAMRMSKSGVFAHFGSREELQLSVIREYERRFADEVFRPALAEPRGLPRLRVLVDRWLMRVAAEVASGCLYIGGAVEFDDRPGAVRDALAGIVRAWQAALEKAIRLSVDEGHLANDTDVVQLVFELHGLVLALHHDARFLQLPGSLERARRGVDRVLGAPPGAEAPRPCARRPHVPAPPSRFD